MILDLRYNPGGLLTAATDVSRQVPAATATIVSTRPDREHAATSRPSPRAQPDDDETRPAAGRAGQPVLRQRQRDRLRRAEGPQARAGRRRADVRQGQRADALPAQPTARRYLKLTTSHYYLPSGRCIHREENSHGVGRRPGRDGRDDPRADAGRDRRPAGAGHPPRRQRRARRGRAGEARGQGPRGPGKGRSPSSTTTTKEKKDLLSSDPQLAAAVLLLRLQLAGGGAQSNLFQTFHCATAGLSSRVFGPHDRHGWTSQPWHQTAQRPLMAKDAETVTL